MEKQCQLTQFNKMLNYHESDFDDRSDPLPLLNIILIIFKTAISS